MIADQAQKATPGSGHGNVLRSLRLDSRQAVIAELQRIGVDPAGVALMADKVRHLTILIPNLRPAAANILKQEMLSLGADAAVARGTIACSIPTTDVLLFGTRKQLLQLCDKLKAQPFGLVSVAAELATLLQSENNLLTWQTSQRTISLERPLLMGILNCTPDSFSDGGFYTSLDTALAHAEAMVEAGAGIIDIGAESMRPGAIPVDGDEELRRLIPLIAAVTERCGVPVSVDTWKSDVAARALEAGAEIINDISGGTFDPAMPALIARSGAGAVLMHTRGTPHQLHAPCHYSDLMAEVTDELMLAARTMLAAGVSRAQLVLDPGLGFSKDYQQTMVLLGRLSELQALGYPLLVGPSRKSFIGRILDRPDPAGRLFGTAASVAWSVLAGASILRVHDVAAMADVMRMTEAIISIRAGEVI